MLKTKMKKGQISTLDLVIASMIFISLLLVAMTTWSKAVLGIYRFETKRTITQKALDVAELLVKTEGDPPNWFTFTLSDINTDNVSSLGLVSQENILDRERLDKMSQLDYGTGKELMGLSREEFNITIKNSTNDVIYSFGIPYDGSNILIKRYVLLDDDLTTFNLRLFTNETLM